MADTAHPGDALQGRPWRVDVLGYGESSPLASNPTGPFSPIRIIPWTADIRCSRSMPVAVADSAEEVRGDGGVWKPRRLRPQIRAPGDYLAVA